MKKLLVIVLCISINGLAQPTLKDEWQRKLTEFYTSTLAVNLHLLFNQPAYAPGDTAYFRAAFLTATEYSPLVGSQIITVNVIDNSGTVQLSQEFRMNNGWSGNQLYIPLDFEPGYYQLIAFNDWMLNFNSKFVFETDFTILGPDKSNIRKFEKTLGVFPEGGNLVAGLRSKIVVTATRFTAVRVTNGRGVTQNEFSTDENGIGYFYLKPENGETYTVATVDDKVTMRSEDEGIVLSLTPALTLQAPHRLILQSTGKTLQKKDLVLVLAHGDKIFYSAVFRFDEKEFVAVNINPRDLPEGVCFLSVNTTEGETLASRLLNNHTRDSVQAVLSLSKKEFNTREGITVDLSVTDINQKPLLARISTSVFRADLFSDPFRFTSLSEQLMLRSNSCCDHRMNSSQLSTATVDNYLITKKWPWYTWKEVFSQPVKAKYDLRDYQSLYGRLVNKDSGEPLKVSAGITFYFSGTGEIHRTVSDNKGEFGAHFLFDFYDREIVYYLVDQDFKKLENVRIELTPRSVNHTNHKVFISDVELSEYGAYSKRRHEFIQAYKFFNDQQNSSAKEALNPNRVMEKIVGGADVDIKLDDYTLFPSMKETLTEVVPFLRNTKIKGKEAVYLFRPEIPIQSEVPPMFMIDGVITDNYEYFLSLNPADVYTIKLIQATEKLNKLSGLGLTGLVLVETKIQNNYKNLLANNNYIAVKGLSKALDFQERLSSWQRNNDRSPRLKPTLFWKPVELLDANGRASFRFNASDDTGRYRIRVEGLTVEGIPFLVEQYFSVTFND